jgi:hypothetical protein
MKHETRYHIPFLVLAILALLLALWAGLLRLGWSLPTFDNLAAAHGPLMVSGFLGTLIPLERAVAIRQKWMFVVPALAGLGWIALLAYPPIGAILLTLGSLGTFTILCVMVRREPSLHTTVMAFGALSWVIGNLFWLAGYPIFEIVLWWIAFLVLTIGGERIELNRVLNLSTNRLRLFAALTALLLTGAVVAMLDLALGSRLSGLSLLGLSLWLLTCDLALRNLQHPSPLTRFIAICLCSGFIWLAISGAMFLYFGALYAGPFYDATLHAVFVGFVIAMIFGHAPIIFPAILGLQVKFYPIFYAHLLLLHTSLVVRMIGNLAGMVELRRWGGLLNEVAILLFLVLTVYSIIKGRKSRESLAS